MTSPRNHGTSGPLFLMRARVCLPLVFPFPSPLALLDPALLMLWPWLADGRARATSQPGSAGRERKLTSPSLKQVIYYQMKNWHDGSGGGESGPCMASREPCWYEKEKGKESKGETRDTGGVLRVLNRKTAFKHQIFHGVFHDSYV